LALNYLPKRGEELVCDYSTGFQAPEMVKKRLCVVISPRLHHRSKVCTIVPISTSEPQIAVKFQCKIELPSPPPEPWPAQVVWVKADMIATVGLGRLDFLWLPRSAGRRKYIKMSVSDPDLQKIAACVQYSLGLQPLDEADSSANV
jgi:mRNA interferase MazF